ncbi:brain tumor protein [Diaphorina citri]|uniref:Brain tumor protein n=1 Tax=Diaphorina citri TaxID=121845 RepID=A0A3Q0JLM8_DIACI|nr:brain tumor protein [Diaphorina citri]KAI5703269.1 hypothetical protein M8J75_009718 [Diaphorina citri]KAI5733512.1 hypothetical protein M8J76_012795 [Diaphorina citri]KAI5738491.1 hypothetical protein M8J77_007753 [Diaphorina citri]
MASPTPSVESGNGSFADGQDYQSLSPLSHSASPTASLSSGSYSSSINKCCVCHESFINPKTLPCSHTYCDPCLERCQVDPDKLTCIRCQQDALTSRSFSSLLADYTINEDRILVPCTSCKSTTTSAVARCSHCDFLCNNCFMAHQYMHHFEGHRVCVLPNDIDDKDEFKSGDKPVYCTRHKTETVKYFCMTCNFPLCKECTLIDHPSGHDYELLSDVVQRLLEIMNQSVTDAKAKANDIKNNMKSMEHLSGHLQVQYHKAQNEINETFLFYRSMLEERKQELLKELESIFSSKQLSLNVVGQKAQETVNKIYQACEFSEQIMKRNTTYECLIFKKLLDSKLQSLMNYSPDLGNKANADLEFVSNFQAIQVAVRNTFGYIRSNPEVNMCPTKQPPIARPTNPTNGVAHINGGGPMVNGTNTILPPMQNSMSNGSMNGSMNGINTINNILERPYSTGISTPTNPPAFESSLISKRFSSANSLGPFSNSINDLNINPYEKWSNGDIFQNGSNDYNIGSGDTILDLTTKLSSMFPPKSQIKRTKMIYHCKFGEFGALEGQFTEPSGVAVNAQNDIIVADTNNHRIQIFDKEGRFKFQFGECGKRDGQLLYPNRVAVVKTSGDIIVTERSPTHQIQIYNQYGQFVRKFGANILQHPRGITVDNKGRIVVVECKVMRVIIFDQNGNVLTKFGCSKHLEFPNGVVVNDKQEIFISDNRAHCVKVFNYEGVFLRQIGSEGVTNYPIGVGINSAGEILIADNHNNFNLTVFTQDGQLQSALESKVKHAQCFDVALMDDGSVVLASKDYRLYIYRYQVPPVTL